MKYFKNNMRKEIFSMKYTELHQKLNDVNIELQKGGMEISRKQNPYAKDSVSGQHDMKKLRYIKSLVIMRLEQLSKEVRHSSHD